MQLFYVWNTEADQLSWTGPAEQVLGYLVSELPPDRAGWLELVDPRDLPRLYEKLNEFLRQRHPVRLTYRVRSKDGSLRPIADECGFISDVEAVGSFIPRRHRRSPRWISQGV